MISNYSEERTVTLNSVKQFDWKNVVKKLTSFYDSISKTGVKNKSLINNPIKYE